MLEMCVSIPESNRPKRHDSGVVDGREDLPYYLMREANGFVPMNCVESPLPDSIANSPWPRSLRHLLWLSQTPSLIRHQRVFDLMAALPADYPDRISRLAACQDWLSALESASQRRLGLYVEELYACLMTEVLGWELLGRNLQIMDGGRTLGELDFLLRNPLSGEVEHHELAVKFYLGTDMEGPCWRGPNSRDRLDLKLARLLEHQVKMAQHHATHAMLAERRLPRPAQSRFLLPGYLFYPEGVPMLPPPDAADNHLHGNWMRASQLDAALLQTCVVLQKPDWLGAWRQDCEPNGTAAIEQAGRIADGAGPTLFAQLEWQEDEWVERRRFFLVPDHWPSSIHDKTK